VNRAKERRAQRHVPLQDFDRQEVFALLCSLMDQKQPDEKGRALVF
jgi:hypothetical protein